ncbi:hypothetical protein GUJ93_ZPchr0002g23345 [Zizania palustris]|uniref:Uncharacterized protein n=1 Tax=Zizania palustris TaxID=103762 RepID=A0A8J5SEZ2_ZIZPA|nr:hypothetical protein GUJ93_ZPchr0002g23345 [Zizania palustris]
MATGCESRASSLASARRKALVVTVPALVTPLLRWPAAHGDAVAPCGAGTAASVRKFATTPPPFLLSVVDLVLNVVLKVSNRYAKLQSTGAK